MSLLLHGKGKGKLLIVFLLLSLSLITHQGVAKSDTKSKGIEPTLYLKGIIPLTPGSSTTVEIKPKGDWALTTVLCLGEGTLEVKLTKDDTEGDLVGMFVMGYPTDPVFIPSFGITPAEISVSTDIKDTLGGYGIALIITVVNSSESYMHELSLALD